MTRCSDSVRLAPSVAFSLDSCRIWASTASRGEPPVRTIGRPPDGAVKPTGRGEAACAPAPCGAAAGRGDVAAARSGCVAVGRSEGVAGAAFGRAPRG